MSRLLDAYNAKKMTARDAVAKIKSGDKVYLSGNAAVPTELIAALAERKNELSDIELLHVLLLGNDPLSMPDMVGHFFHNAMFVGPGDREAVNSGRAGYIPSHLHEMPKIVKDGIIKLNAAFVQTSPPDEHGFVSLGVEVLMSKAAVEAADYVVAQVNPLMPRTLGNSFIHISQIDAFVESSLALPQLSKKPFSETEYKIGEHIANLIEDGSTLQLGIGGIPDAVLSLIEGKRDLGIHTEMISDGIVEAVDKGIITGARKTLHPGKVIATFILGSEKLYEYVNDNPLFELHPADYTNDPFIVAQNHKMVAINSALQVDLTGQVSSDSIGTRIYSGFGGQLDFIRGASHSPGGKPIIAISSTAQDGKVSRIVPELLPGAGVVTTRADVHYVVTEFGVANLYGRNLQERAKALIAIAHPDFREELTEKARERNLI